MKVITKKKPNLTWKDFFQGLNSKHYCLDLIKFIDKERERYTIYPKRDEVLNAFKLTNYKDIKVVLIGQDPYINENEAMGLSFSVKENTKLPPSLKNIYKEIELEYKDLNKKMNFKSGDLTYLARQGVFLINTILTVRKGSSLSHNTKEYRHFFIDLMKYLDKNDNPIVFLLLGNRAQKYEKYILNKNRCILKSSHPSPLSANRGGFFHSNIFINTNKYLKNNNIKEINWFNS